MNGRYGLIGLVLVVNSCASVTPTERARIYHDDAVAQYQAGNYAAARESYQAALQFAPEDVHIVYRIGECHARLGNSAEAQRYYEACLEQTPQHAECRHALATLLVESGRWKEASAMVQDWMAREPKQAAAYAEDGWLWQQAGDWPRAKDRYQQALNLDARNVRALNGLAQVYEVYNRPDRALVLYERSVGADSNQPAIEERITQLREEGVVPPRPD